MRRLPFRRLRQDEYARLPTRSHPDDIGLDLLVSRDTKIRCGEVIDVPCNVAVALPRGTFGLIVGRSSTVRTRRLYVHPGVIDSGWRGELFALVSRLDGEPAAPVVEVKQGERIAQLLVLPFALLHPEWAAGGLLSQGDRGVAGFGSTGA